MSVSSSTTSKLPSPSSSRSAWSWLDGGTTAVEGEWVARVVGLDDVRAEVALVRTPDGHGRLELTKFHNPSATTAEPNAPANTFGLRRIMFAVDDVDAVKHRATNPAVSGPCSRPPTSAAGGRCRWASADALRRPGRVAAGRRH
jgi:hypothetical protein